MDAADASHGLLAHFDQPIVPQTTAQVPSRGVGWVLQWFAALVTLCVAAAALTKFGYCASAERALIRAARAGAVEATLPRATYQSVVAAVERRLTGYPERSAERLRISLQQNGKPVRGVIRPADGNRLTVALAVPSEEMLPGWLRALAFWHSGSAIEGRAERHLPGRRLARR